MYIYTIIIIYTKYKNIYTIQKYIYNNVCVCILISISEIMVQTSFCYSVIVLNLKLY